MSDLHALQKSPAAFRRALRIDADGTLRPLGDVLDPWQETDFALLDDGWKAVAGHHEGEQPVQRAYLERPRGHSKTSDLAVSATWVLFASKRKLNGYAAAADRDQAKLLHDSIETLVRANPWLNDILDIRSYSVINKHTGSVLEILSADAASAYGLRPDFLVVDELTHWPKRDLWDALISAAAKKSRCVVIIITNAGFGESWQWDTRESIRNDPDWLFSRIDGPKASWITEKRLAEQRRLLPKIAFQRLWLNQWTAGVGDALDHDDIARALVLDGPQDGAEPGWVYFAGLDLGLSRDKAALAVVGRHVGHWKENIVPPPPTTSTQRALIELGLREAPEPEEPESIFVPATNKLRLCALEVWDPKESTNGRVSIEAVERAIVALDQRFTLTVGADPWQTAYVTERLVKRGIPSEPVNFMADNLKSMCSATLEAFTENNLELYDHGQLLHDLRSLRVVEKNYGVRLDSPRGISGHGDCATALSIALHLARTKAGLSARPVDRTIIAV